MKRIVPFILILFLFTGCEIKEYTPEIPCSFTQKAKVTSGDFSFDCEICKTEENVIVTVLSTSAAGMVMTYNGSELVFVYENYSHSVDGNRFEPSNTAIMVYEVFDCIANEETTARKIDGGYQYDGKITIGDFSMIQNDDNSLKSMSVRSAGISIDFSL